jgi:hypothetical protein
MLSSTPASKKLNDMKYEAIICEISETYIHFSSYVPGIDYCAYSHVNGMFTFMQTNPLSYVVIIMFFLTLKFDMIIIIIKIIIMKRWTTKNTLHYFRDFEWSYQGITFPRYYVAVNIIISSTYDNIIQPSKRIGFYFLTLSLYLPFLYTSVISILGRVYITWIRYRDRFCNRHVVKNSN